MRPSASPRPEPCSTRRPPCMKSPKLSSRTLQSANPSRKPLKMHWPWDYICRRGKSCASRPGFSSVRRPTTRCRSKGTTPTRQSETTAKLFMSHDVAESFAFLKGLGTPKDLAVRSEAGHPPIARLKNNCHIHLPPNFSAFETVTQALELSAAQGISVLGASNYYD